MGTVGSLDVAKKKVEPKESRFEMRTDTVWLRRVERQAERFGLTLTGYIRRAVQLELERDEATDTRKDGDA